MGKITGIEWTDHTFNPWVGCQHVSMGCDFCYAEAHTKRFGGDFAVRRRTTPANWRQPPKWNRAAEDARKPARVFCASMADVFDNQVDSGWRADLWKMIKATPWLDWQLLTKRPQNIAAMLPPDWGDGYHNVWLGTSAENQIEADRRIRHLQAVPARLRFVSCEPLLEQVTLYLARIHWVICGGESGPGARPMHPDWPRTLREQCKASDVAFFFKQWGEYHPEDQPNDVDGEDWGSSAEYPDGTIALRVGKRRAGHVLDGVVHQDFPQCL